VLENVPGNSYEFAELDTSGAGLLPLNCLYHDALLKAADMATLLGLPSDATDYRNTASLVAGGIQAQLFDGTDRYRDSTGSTRFSSLSSVLPLYFGITPAADREAVFDYVKSVGSPPEPLGAYFFYGLLVKKDEDKLLHRLLDQTQAQWGLMVASGSTTTWEAFIPDFSRGHGWSASPMQLFPSGIVGVKPTRQGYSSWEVRPHLGSLSRAEVMIPTVKGDIPVAWRHKPDGLTLKLTVPANTTARVHIPAAGFLHRRITESGQVVFDNGGFVGGVPGVIFAGKEGGYISFDLGSGTYAFRQTGLQPEIQTLPPGQRIKK